jgi:uncharacterized protein (TIGR00255 family)
MQSQPYTIQSMTGFATGHTHGDGWDIVWEIRCINNRFTDIVLRLPEIARTEESPIRACINQTIRRGRIDAVLNINRRQSVDNEININASLLGKLRDALEEVQSMNPNVSAPSSLDLLKWPGVLVDNQDQHDLHMPLIQEALASTLSELIRSRMKEGQAIAELIEQRCEQIELLVSQARQRFPSVMDSLRLRLISKIQELKGEPDQERLEQELVYYAQKLDVAEELDRLQVHLSEVRRSLKSQEPMGRRLDFLTQELNREANTLGAKSQDHEMTRISVDIKVLIEQIKEQVQNVE